MKWIVYITLLERFGHEVQQVRRAPILDSADPHLMAEQLGGRLLATQTDIRKAEGLRRLIEIQSTLAGQAVAEWSAPEDWEREAPLSFPRPRFDVGQPYPRLALLA